MARAAQLGALQRLLTVLDPELAATIAHPPELECGGDDMAWDFAIDWVMLLGKRQFDGQQVRDGPTSTKKKRAHLQSCTFAEHVFCLICCTFRASDSQQDQGPCEVGSLSLCRLMLSDAAVQQRSWRVRQYL